MSEAGQKELIPGVFCRNEAHIYYSVASSSLDFNRLTHAMASCINICRIETFASMLFSPGPVFSCMVVWGFFGIRNETVVLEWPRNYFSDKWSSFSPALPCHCFLK